MIMYRVHHPTDEQLRPEDMRGTLVSMKFFDWRRFRRENGLNDYSRKQYGTLMLDKVRRLDPWK